MATVRAGEEFETPEITAKVRAKLSQLDAVVGLGPFRAEWLSLQGYTVPAWYSDAKFGIFIHRGVFSVPAFDSEWYPRNMYQQGSPEFAHHVKTYGPQSKFGYKDFIPDFNGARFDAGQWASLFKQAGRGSWCRLPSTTTGSRYTTAASPNGTRSRRAPSAT